MPAATTVATIASAARAATSAIFATVAASAQAIASAESAAQPPAAPGRTPFVVWLGLFAAGLAISGFTIRRGVEPFDEGLTLQAARRVADGQVPYSDFLWAYGPAHVYLLAGLFKAFGTSLLWWRIVRVLVDAAIAVLVFKMVERGAPRRVAGVAWLTAICAMAQPTGPSPFAPALLCTLA